MQCELDLFLVIYFLYITHYLSVNKKKKKFILANVSEIGV